MHDFGGKLRQAREARGISLRQIAANTKISVGALEALERNDISKLPGGIFSRAFVRSYATEVGLDPEETVADFLERFQAEPLPEPLIHASLSQHADDLTERRAAGLAVQAILAILVFAGMFAFFALRGGDRSAAQTEPPSAPAARTEVATTPPPTTQPPAAPAVDDVLRARGPMRLELHPTGPCWIKLRVDGEDIFARLMQNGDREAVTVKQIAVISIGDAGAFGYSVDGRPGRILGSSGEVKTARITRETLPEYLR